MTDRISPAIAPPAQHLMAEETGQTRSRRCLVLGSTGHGVGVRSFAWDRLPSDLNVADYDVVVLNFAAFEDRELAERLDKEQLPPVRSLTRLVFSPNAEVIVIGNPATTIGSWPEDALMQAVRPPARCDYWLPFDISVEDDRGTQFEVEDPEWA